MAVEARPLGRAGNKRKMGGVVGVGVEAERKGGNGIVRIGFAGALSA
jgi:hypothetical protein